jgi:thiamine biosynthesis lipoprotein
MAKLARQARVQRQVLVPPDLSSRGMQRGGKVVRLSGETMGTTWHLAYRHDAGADADRAADRVAGAVQMALDTVVAQMSTWLDGSDISRYNSAPPQSWHPLPAAFATVLGCALDVAGRSDGAFDPTIGPVVDAWGFGRRGGRRTPSSGELADARSRVGWQRLAFAAAREMIYQPGGVGLDLSSIAKGFGVDEMARCLERVGLDSYLCEIGGELRGSGCKPDGSPWWVRLESPSDCAPDHDTVLALCGKAVATSGDYVRTFHHDGRNYGHTIDPRTGSPIRHALLAVSVVADDCMTADALATAILVLGPQAGLAWATREGVAARLVIAEKGRATCAYTPALGGYL